MTIDPLQKKFLIQVVGIVSTMILAFKMIGFGSTYFWGIPSEMAGWIEGSGSIGSQLLLFVSALGFFVYMNDLVFDESNPRIMAYLVPVAFLVIFFVGFFQTKSQDTFLVSVKDPSMIVLSSSDKYFLLGRVDLKNMQLVSPLTMSIASRKSDGIYTLEKIGPIKPPIDQHRGLF